MKNIKIQNLLLLILSTSLLYGSVHASIKEDLNNLIDHFFGSAERDAPMQEVSDPGPSLSPALKQELENIEHQDIQALKEKVFLHEAALNDIEQQIENLENNLQQAQSDRSKLQTQLTILDSERALQNQKLQTLQTQYQHWKSMIENITREKASLEALLRATKREQSLFVNKKVIQEEQGSYAQNLSLIRWIFSDKRLSQIILEDQVAREKESQITTQIKTLQEIQASLRSKEKQVAYLLGHTHDLKQKVAQQKKHIQELADAKALLLQQQLQTQYQDSEVLQSLRQQQAESTIYLQNIRTELSSREASEEITNAPPTSFFRLPLMPPVSVSASFQDPLYEKSYGRKHNGIDFSVPQGTSVLAAADGQVKKVAHNGLGYSYLILEHDYGFYTVYGHLSRIDVQEGLAVQQGDPIALSGGEPGKNGAGYFTSGPHLHFEIFSNGQFVDPSHYLPLP